MKRVPLILRASIVLATIAASAPLAWSQVNVLTHHNDNLRTGANLHETDLTVASVKQKFGKLWTLFADGQIVAQPLYVSGLQVDGKGTFNAVIVATMHNTIYAYDADKKPTLPQSQDALIWAQWLGQPQPEKFGFDSWNTNFPEYGIVSTPVIDDARTTMYVVSWHNDNGGQFRLHAIDLTKAPFPARDFRRSTIGKGSNRCRSSRPAYRSLAADSSCSTPRSRSSGRRFSSTTACSISASRRTSRRVGRCTAGCSPTTRPP